MATRNCPSCNVILGLYDSYFCSSCGEVLPEELVLPSRFYLREISLDLEIPTHRKIKDILYPVFQNVAQVLNVKEVILVLAGVALIVPIYFVVMNLNNTMEGNNENVVEEQIVRNVLDVEDEFKSNVFGANFVTDYIPENIDLYFEGQDFSKFSELVGLSDTYYSFLFDRLARYVDSHFAYYVVYRGEDFSWAMVLFPFEKFWEDFYPDLDLGDGVYFGRIESALVLSNSEDLIRFSNNSKGKLSKNLTLSPDFTSYKNHMAKSGQFLIVTFTERGHEYVESISEIDLPDEFKVLLKMYLDQNSEYVVFN